MFITKMSLPRRTFLRGMGATVALPLLEAMVPALTATAKTAANPPRRFGAVYIPHGAIMDQWTPAARGRRLRVHADPEAARAVPRSTGRRQQPRRGRATTAGDHAVSAAAWLSGVERQADRRRGLPPRHDDRSDHREADRPGHAVPVARARHRGLHRLRRRVHARLQLRLHEHDLLGSPTTPLPMEINPRVVFERLFGGPGTPRAAPRACGRTEHPRLRSPTRLGDAAARSGAPRPRPARRVSRQHPRDRAAHPADRRAQPARS